MQAALKCLSLATRSLDPPATERAWSQCHAVRRSRLVSIMPLILLLWKDLPMRADSQPETAVRIDHADDQVVELAVEIFKMLADATRVRIVLALRGGELSVNTLADVVGKSPAAVSQHLAKLRLARLVATRHEGNRVFYRLANEHAQQLAMGAVFQAEHSVEDQPRHHRITEEQ